MVNAILFLFYLILTSIVLGDILLRILIRSIILHTYWNRNTGECWSRTLRHSILIRSVESNVVDITYTYNFCFSLLLEISLLSRHSGRSPSDISNFCRNMWVVHHGCQLVPHSQLREDKSLWRWDSIQHSYFHRQAYIWSGGLDGPEFVSFLFSLLKDYK